MKSIIILACALLAGCAGMQERTREIDWDRKPPADWPKLAVSTHILTPGAMREACKAVALPLGQHPLACAMVDFCSMTCKTFYTRSSFEPFIIEHEHAHCAGYDHPGASTMRDYWGRWKLAGGERQCFRGR